MTGKHVSKRAIRYPRSKLEDPFTSLFYRRDWPEKPYDIDFLEKKKKGPRRR